MRKPWDGLACGYDYLYLSGDSASPPPLNQNRRSNPFLNLPRSNLWITADKSPTDYSQQSMSSQASYFIISISMISNNYSKLEKEGARLRYTNYQEGRFRREKDKRRRASEIEKELLWRLALEERKNDKNGDNC